MVAVWMDWWQVFGCLIDFRFWTHLAASCVLSSLTWIECAPSIVVRHWVLICLFAMLCACPCHSQVCLMRDTFVISYCYYSCHQLLCCSFWLVLVVVILNHSHYKSTQRAQTPPRPLHCCTVVSERLSYKMPYLVKPVQCCLLVSDSMS